MGTATPGGPKKEHSKRLPNTSRRSKKRNLDSEIKATPFDFPPAFLFWKRSVILLVSSFELILFFFVLFLGRPCAWKIDDESVPIWGTFVWQKSVSPSPPNPIPFPTNPKMTIADPLKFFGTRQPWHFGNAEGGEREIEFFWGGKSNVVRFVWAWGGRLFFHHLANFDSTPTLAGFQGCTAADLTQVLFEEDFPAFLPFPLLQYLPFPPPLKKKKENT